MSGKNASKSKRSQTRPRRYDQNLVGREDHGKRKSGRSQQQAPSGFRKTDRLGTPSEDRTDEAWLHYRLTESLSNEDLECIMEVTRVPEEFKSYARMYVDMAVYLLEFREWRRDSGRARLVTNCRERLAHLSQELSDAISEAVDQLGKDSILLNFSWSREDDEEDFDPYDLMLLLATFAEQCEPLPMPKGAANRPRGTVQSPELRFLIGELFESIVEKCHGELTLWQAADGELKGSLPTVLKILHDRLPAKVPANPSYATLRRYMLRRQTSNFRPSNKA